METLLSPNLTSNQREDISQLYSGAELLILSLLEEKVDTIFGYPGGAIMPVYDALYSYQDKIFHILTRHEQGATHAAQGYARVSGKAGVCLATSGPGATNLITGIADAQIDSTPLVCITGQVASHLLGTDAFQETDVVGISMPVTKWNVQITKAADIPKAISKAFFIAQSGRPGPVLVDITKDAQMGYAKFEYKRCEAIRSYVPQPLVCQTQLEKAAALINNAKKPYLLFGQGILLGKAEKELKTFLEKTGIPAAATLLGLSALPCDHPLYVGMLGMHGNYAANILTNQCDVLIAVGMRFDDRVTGAVDKYAKQAKVIHLELDASEINKIVTAEVPVLGNCKTSLALLIQKCNKNQHDSWLKKFKELELCEFEKVKQKELHRSENEEISMAEVIALISELADPEAIICSDVGQHQMVTKRYYQYKYPRTNITSGGLGTMGFCLPAAFGAKMAKKNKQVIAVVGDGGFQMTIQELGTIFQTGLDLKILLLNNEFLGMVRQWQELFFEKRYASTELINPDFQTIARGYGISPQKVTERKNLKAAVERFLKTKGSSLLEVMVGKENNVFPMVPAGAGIAEMILEANS